MAQEAEGSRAEDFAAEVISACDGAANRPEILLKTTDPPMMRDLSLAEVPTDFST